MKLIKALTLPTALAAMSTAHSILDDCDGDLTQAQTKNACLKSVFKTFNQMLDGPETFPKKLKKDIKQVLLQHSSEPIEPIPCSVEGLTFPPQNFTGAGPCDDGMFCRYNQSPFGSCAICPPAGENCSNDGIFTVHDYNFCCNSCPDAVCDVESFIEDERQDKLKKSSKKCDVKKGQVVVPEQPIAKRTLILRIPMADNINVMDFLFWFNQAIEDTRNWPGCLSAELNVEYVNPARGITRDTVMLELKFDSAESEQAYMFWRFMSGMWTLVKDWAYGFGDGLDVAVNFQSVNNYDIVTEEQIIAHANQKTPSGTPSSSSPSSPSETPKTPCTLTEPCQEGNFCSYDFLLSGICQVCPPAGENCDATLTTLNDYQTCCRTCPDVVCDSSWMVNSQQQNKSYIGRLQAQGKAIPEPKMFSLIEVTVQPQFLDMFRFGGSSMDTMNFEGNLGSELTVERNSTRLQIWGYWENEEDFINYLTWRGAVGFTNTLAFVQVPGTNYNYRMFRYKTFENTLTNQADSYINSIDYIPTPTVNYNAFAITKSGQKEEFLPFFNDLIIGETKNLKGVISNQIMVEIDLSTSTVAPFIETELVYLVVKVESDEDADALLERIENRLGNGVEAIMAPYVESIEFPDGVFNI